MSSTPRMILATAVAFTLTTASTFAEAGGTCGDSAHVSYIGHHNENDDDLMLEFSVFEPHKSGSRAILWRYEVTYSCYRRGRYSKRTLTSAVLDPGSNHTGKDDEFIASECPLPDHSYPHIESVEITAIDCN